MVLLLLLLLPAGLVTAFAFAGHGFATLGRFGLRRAGREVWLRCLASFLAAAACAGAAAFEPERRARKDRAV
jgi:hypothetical protein